MKLVPEEIVGEVNNVVVVDVVAVCIAVVALVGFVFVEDVGVVPVVGLKAVVDCPPTAVLRWPAVPVENPGI